MDSPCSTLPPRYLRQQYVPSPGTATRPPPASPPRTPWRCVLPVENLGGTRWRCSCASLDGIATRRHRHGHRALRRACPRGASRWSTLPPRRPPGGPPRRSPPGRRRDRMAAAAAAVLAAVALPPSPTGTIPVPAVAARGAGNHKTRGPFKSLRPQPPPPDPAQPARRSRRHWQATAHNMNAWRLCSRCRRPRGRSPRRRMAAPGCARPRPTSVAAAVSRRRPGSRGRGPPASSESALARASPSSRTSLLGRRNPAPARTRRAVVFRSSLFRRRQATAGRGSRTLPRGRQDSAAWAPGGAP